MYFVPFAIMRWHEWTPLSMPIDVRPDVVRSPSFQVDQPVTYRIELEADRSLNLDELNCLLGLDRPRHGCGNLKSVVDISWRLLTAERTIASGSSKHTTGGGWGPTVTRSIGRFKGTPDTTYVLEVRPELDGSALALANPRIVVRVNTETYTGYLIIAQMLQTAAKAVGVAALMWLLLWAWRTYGPFRKA
jgi:hypothetical protein